MKNRKVIWRIFLGLSFFVFVCLLSIILFFSYRDDFQSPFDVEVADQFTCPDGRDSFANPAVVATCPFAQDPEACIADAPQGCVNISHPQGIGGTDPFCTPGVTETRDGSEYLCVGYPYGSDGCVYFTGCRGMRLSSSGTDEVPPELCGPDGTSNCTLENDGTCGSVTENNQRILCVSNVDNSTVCYERNDECTVAVENPDTTDPVDSNQEQGNGSTEESDTDPESTESEVVADTTNTQTANNSGLSTLPNTSKSSTFSLTLLLGLSFLMVGLILNRLGNPELFLNSIKTIEKRYSIVFPDKFKNFLEKRNKNMVDYERKRFESSIENGK